MNYSSYLMVITAIDGFRKLNLYYSSDFTGCFKALSEMSPSSPTSPPHSNKRFLLSIRLSYKLINSSLFTLKWLKIKINELFLYVH